MEDWTKYQCNCSCFCNEDAKPLYWSTDILAWCCRKRRLNQDVFGKDIIYLDDEEYYVQCGEPCKFFYIQGLGKQPLHRLTNVTDILSQYKMI